MFLMGLSAMVLLGTIFVVIGIVAGIVLLLVKIAFKCAGKVLSLLFFLPAVLMIALGGLIFLL